jgi:DNA-binding LytR/AlgR family response regulator
MTALRVLIVDDEPAARVRLRRLLEEIEVECAGEAANGVEALERVAGLKPDVILLDIAMPEVTGLDVARHLPAGGRPAVIFQTAHDEHAVAAFEQEAIDYLLKPVTRERLAVALDRAARRLALGSPGPAPDAIGRVERATVRTTSPARRLLVRSGAGHRLLPTREIAQFTAQAGLARAVTPSASYLTDYTLADLAARLEGTFVRVSRSDLVNIDWIDRVTGEGDGSATLVLRDARSVHVTRRRAAAVRNAIER